MTEQVVMIFRERNDVNVCCIPLSAYPTGNIPEVVDKIALQASKTFLTSNTVGGQQEETNIKYFDDLVTVTEVWAGNGDLLHPNSGCSMYSFNDDAEGYGIRAAWDTEVIPPGVTPVEAAVVFGL